MKIGVVLLSVVLAGAVLVTPGLAQQAASGQDASAAKKDAKWQGTIVRMDKDKSMITIHGGPAPSTSTRQVMYDSSTQFTNLGKPGQMDDLKDNSFIIALGQVDSKGIMHASRVDLRMDKAQR